MLVRLTRGKKGKPDILTCVRDDGSTTWMHEHHAFAIHDLAHYAVETSFGIQNGLYGLVAHGWELSSADFGRDPRTKERYPWPGGEQQPVEHIVSLFQQGDLLGIKTPAQLREALAMQVERVPPYLTDERIEAVWRLIAALERRWADVPEGESLELQYSA